MKIDSSYFILIYENKNAVTKLSLLTGDIIYITYEKIMNTTIAFIVGCIPS